MITITRSAESKLLQALNTLKGESQSWRAVVIKSSRLADPHTIKSFSKNTYRHLLETINMDDAKLFMLECGDVALLCTGVPKARLDEIIDYTYEIATADLAQHNISLEGFAYIHDLGVAWDQMHNWAEVHFEQCSENKPSDNTANETELTPSSLIEDDMRDEIFAKAKQQREQREKPVILTVEDDILTRRLIQNTLRGSYQLIEAENATRALDMYLLHAPDVVFLDIGLPDKSGHEVLADLTDIDADTHAVMLSGNSFKEDIIKAMEKGDKGFVGKPFTKEKLHQHIQKAPFFDQQMIAAP